MGQIDFSRPLEKLEFVVDDKIKAQRLDSALQILLPHRSRSFFQKKIKSGDILLQGKTARASHILKNGEKIIVKIHTEHSWVNPDDIALNIIFENEDLIVINKEAGQIIHPTGATQSGTLINALHARHHHLKRELKNLPRVLHRLDADTSGVLAFSHNKDTSGYYGQLFEKRLSQKIYLTILEGHISREFQVTKALGPDEGHPVKLRQWVRSDGKKARSDFFPLANHAGKSLCAVRIHSGRLHQIRVHSAFSGHPVVGDKLYNPQDEDFSKWCPNEKSVVKRKNRPCRQMLHAWRLSFEDPRKKKLNFLADLPKDFKMEGKYLLSRWVKQGQSLPEAL
jgi:23S rRNA pseudouridine1911/1915/1917 synthase